MTAKQSQTYAEHLVREYARVWDEYMQSKEKGERFANQVGVLSAERKLRELGRKLLEADNV